MKKTTGIFCALAALFSASCCSHSGASGHALPEVELSRYAGKWYEVARFENFFQHGLRDCSAVYELMPDGRVRVVNSGTAPDGSRRESAGIGVWCRTPRRARSLGCRSSARFTPTTLCLRGAAATSGRSWARRTKNICGYFRGLRPSRSPSWRKFSAAPEKLGYDVKKLVYNAL